MMIYRKQSFQDTAPKLELGSEQKGLRDAGYDFRNHKVGEHEHTFKGDRAEEKVAIEFNKVGHDDKGAWYAGDYAQRGESPTENNPSGETRPKNIPMNYYIKIN